MEARQTLRGSAVPKGLVILLVMCAAVGLAVAGAAVSKNLAGSGATESVIAHPAAGTVLRQDAGGSPDLIDRASEGQASQASQAAPSRVGDGRSSGTQSIEDGAAAPAQTAEPNYGVTHGNRYI